ncbi:MAG TPA: efflux RND transporter periplasmic adaptor subunit [Myxococcaceae bacterium]
MRRITHPTRHGRLLRWLLVGALFAAASGCRRAPADPEAPPLSVELAVAAPRDIEETVHLAGTLEPLPGRSARLGTLVPGRLAEVRVAEGDPVRKGQILARVDPTPLRDAVRQAEASLSQARAQELNARAHLQRAAELFDAGAGPRKDLEDAEAAQASAQAARRTAEASLSLAQNQTQRGEIISPLDGVVAHVLAAPGEPMDGTGKPIIEVDQPDVLELRGELAPGPASRIHPDAVSRVRAAGVGQIRAGRVRAVSPAVDPNTGLVTVRVEVDNHDGAFKVGVAGEADVVVAVKAGALSVPAAALLSAGGEGGARAVNVVDPEGRVGRRTVDVGAVADGWAEIRSGLTAGQPVVVGGTYALPEGTRVVGTTRDGGTG